MQTEQKTKIGVGVQIGHLTVEAPSSTRKNGYILWNCRCDCGGSIQLDTRCLQRGTVRDCGCRTRVKPGMKNLTGQRFGALVCLYPTEKRVPAAVSSGNAAATAEIPVWRSAHS